MEIKGSCNVIYSSLQSAWCNWFAGRCLRRTFQTRVTSCLTSGCHNGLMQRIRQHGSSAITQLTNNNTWKIWDVQISNFRLLMDVCVFGFVVWNNGLLIRKINMNVSMACHCIISWGSSVHWEMFSLWTLSILFLLPCRCSFPVRFFPQCLPTETMNWHNFQDMVGCCV
jgi:hypothetical protein